MSATNSAVAASQSYAKAEEAIRELQKSGFDMKKLSILGKDYHTDEHVVGYYNAGNRIMSWGSAGALWGGFWSLLFGSAFFAIPGVSPILVAVPISMWIVGVLESSVVVGGFSALGAALASIGIPSNSMLQYETEIKNGKLLLVVHGTSEEVVRAKSVLQSESVTTTIHAEPALTSV